MPNPMPLPNTITVEPFFVEVIADTAWPPIPASAGAGIAHLLQTAVRRASGHAAAGAVRIRGRVWIADRWQAEIELARSAPEGWERYAEEAAFDQAHHLLYRLAEWTLRQLGSEMPEAVIRGFQDLRTASPGATLAFWAGWGASGEERRALWMRAFELDAQFVAARVALAQWILDAGGAAAAAAGLALGMNVQDPHAASELGLALWAAGELVPATELLQAAVQGNPKDGLASAGLAALLARRGAEGQALDEALLLATQATQLASDDYRCWAALADVYRAQGDFKQAGFYYGFALRLEPQAAGVLKDAGASWLLARQPDQALPLIERALAAAPDDAENFGNLAFARDLMGDAAAALAAARRAAALSPADARLRILHGDLAHKAGRREEALRAWAQATELNPGMTINPEGGNIGLPPGPAAEGSGA